jgi:hypothetical protein
MTDFSKIDPDWQKWKCRCSAINNMMSASRDNAPLTEIQKKRVAELMDKVYIGNITPKQKEELAVLNLKDENSKTVVLSDSCVGVLLDAYAWETEKMFSVTKEMDVEAFDRGRKTEPESIKLLSEVDGTCYLKNEERFENDFLSGIPDVMDISEEFTARRIRDTKSTKDYPMFLYKIHKGLDPGNAEQLQGYGDILQCGDLGVAFTLPTMPQDIREGYKYRLALKMGEATTESPRFLRAWADLERSMVFDHMPAKKRVYKIPVQPFEKEYRQAVYEKVKVCREWLFNFHEMYLKLNQ